MNKKILVVLVLLLVFSFNTKAFASLTFTTDAITGTTTSSIDLGAGNDLLLQTSGGSVGVGMITPTTTLDVNGTLNVSSSATVGDASTTVNDYNLNTVSPSLSGIKNFIVTTNSQWAGAVFGQGRMMTGTTATSPVVSGGEFIGSEDSSATITQAHSLRGVTGLAYLTSATSTNGNATGIIAQGVNISSGGTGAVTAGGNFTAGTTGANTVTTAYGVVSAIAAGTGTLTNAYGVHSNSPVAFSGGVITKFASLVAGNATTATSNTLLLLGTSTIPTGNFSIYNPSIYTNYFAGNVGIGTDTPGASSILDISSTTKGVVLPRMTKVQRDAIVSKVAGMAIYQTDAVPGLRVYNGTNWMRFTETAD